MKCLKLARTMFPLLFAVSLFAEDKPAVAAAPLPTLLTTATRVFISNAGEQDNIDCLRAYNEFYAGVVATNRLKPVLNPSDAELILELRYVIQVGATHGDMNGSNAKEARQFRLSFIDPKTHIILWTIVEAENSAVFKSNRDKNLDSAMSALLEDLTNLTANATPAQGKQKHAIK